MQIYLQRRKIIVAIMIACVTLASWLYIQSDRRQAFQARFDALSKDVANESRRVENPSGFSIIIPARWEHSVYYDPDSKSDNKISAWRSKQRYSDGFTVWLLDAPPTAEQRDSGLRTSGESNGLENPRLTNGIEYISSGQQWFKIQYVLQGEFDSLPAGLRQVFSTIRCEPKLKDGE